MADQLPWRDAIIAVLKDKAPNSVHYADVAEEIAKRDLRSSFGATPANTVNVYMSESINSEGTDSPFDRTSRGYYRLREFSSTAYVSLAGRSIAPLGAEQRVGAMKPLLGDADETAGFINALGMCWSRDKVIWSSQPRLLGKQATGGEVVDFSSQRGVYLLYDRNAVVYVGRATDQGIASRLKQHTVDRLNGRWDRFSWFGIYAVSPDGALVVEAKQVTAEMLIATMEALLIESVEPSQNRRRGDDFRAVEFLQAIDPEIERNSMQQTIRELEKRFYTK